MTNPWSALTAAPGAKQLYLDPEVLPGIEAAYRSYEESLLTLLGDRLDTIGECFGTKDNPAATLLQDAFNSRGTEVTNYCKAQLSQAKDFSNTAHDAAAAIQHADGA
jgi:hypothetical protein